MWIDNVKRDSKLVLTFKVYSAQILFKNKQFFNQQLALITYAMHEYIQSYTSNTSALNKTLIGEHLFSNLWNLLFSSVRRINAFDQTDFFTSFHWGCGSLIPLSVCELYQLLKHAELLPAVRDHYTDNWGWSSLNARG